MSTLIQVPPTEGPSLVALALPAHDLTNFLFVCYLLYLDLCRVLCIEL